MFIMAFFIITKNEKQPKMSFDRQIQNCGSSTQWNIIHQ